MSFRDRKPRTATHIIIPFVKESIIIKKMNNCRKLVTGKIYRFKLTDSKFSSEYIATFYKEDKDRNLIFKNVDRYDINFNLIDDHSNLIVLSEDIEEILNIKQIDLIKEKYYRFRRVGQTSEYHGKFVKKNEYEYEFSNVNKYNKIGMFIGEYNNLIVSFDELKILRVEK